MADMRRDRSSDEMVVPGEVIGLEDHLAGYGTYQKGSDIISSRIGVRSLRGDTLSIIPIRGKYLPRRNDLLIGIVRDFSNTNWSFEINSPYPASLHFRDVPWDVEFGDTGRHLTIGDSALLKVQDVDVHYRTALIMNAPGLKKLASGRLIRVNPTIVPLVIGKSGSMITMLKGMSQCRMFVGQNGIIWIDGEIGRMVVVIMALNLIEHNYRSLDLRERIETFLGKQFEGMRNGTEREVSP